MPASSGEGSIGEASIRRRGFPRILGLSLVAVAVLLLALYLLRHPILRGFGELLTHDDPIVPSDAIVVLSGDEDTRPFHAAELYRRGIAPVVAIPQEQLTPTARLGLAISDTEIALQVLRDNGVPQDSIVLLSPDRPVTSTRDEAQALRTFAQERGLRRMTVVTSPFHTARARYTIRKALDGLPVEVRMSAAPEWMYDPAEWWLSEEGITDYGMEAVRWVYTLRVLE